MDVRDEVVDYVRSISSHSHLKISHLVQLIDISRSRYYDWIKRYSIPNQHNGKIPKEHWLTDEEKNAIINKAKSHISAGNYSLEDGYRRITYSGIDANDFACSASTVYRVLRGTGLLQKFKPKNRSKKGNGYKQPTAVHQEWHTDIKYINFNGVFIYFIGVIDGYSRYIVHHEIRMTMNEYDVEIVIQRALEKFPEYRPKIITDNGGQYVSIDFKQFIKLSNLQHIRTSPAYPQANGKIERFHRTLEGECLRKTSLLTIDDARHQIDDYIKHYNNNRLHSSLGYLTPNDIIAGKEKQLLGIREIKLKVAKKKRKAYWEQNAIAA